MRGKVDSERLVGIVRVAALAYAFGDASVRRKVAPLIDVAVDALGGWHNFNPDKPPGTQSLPVLDWLLRMVCIEADALRAERGLPPRFTSSAETPQCDGLV
jgi:hypothetical protein